MLQCVNSVVYHASLRRTVILETSMGDKQAETTLYFRRQQQLQCVSNALCPVDSDTVEGSSRLQWSYN